MAPLLQACGPPGSFCARFRDPAAEAKGSATHPSLGASHCYSLGLAPAFREIRTMPNNETDTEQVEIAGVWSIMRRELMAAPKQARQTLIFSFIAFDLCL